MSDYYEVIMDGGGPWGIRLQGGKDFGVPLNVARVTPQSKASMKGLTAGDQILSINNNNTDTLTHMEAQNLIKGARDRLHLGLRKGTGVSLGDAKEIGAGGFNANPNQTLYQTEVTHSAGVDHKFNAKPHAFITQHNASSGGVTQHSEQLNKFDPSKRTTSASSAPRFDPGEYARKKKEELENYKKEPKSDDLVDSDVLQMLKKTTVQEPKGQTGLQHQEPPPPPPQPVAFRMTADSIDLTDVSHGSSAVMEEIKSRKLSDLNPNPGAQASGGSKSFSKLQNIISKTDQQNNVGHYDDDEDLPPPPPELMGLNDPDMPQVQSSSFKMLENAVNEGRPEMVRTSLDPKPRTTSQTTQLHIRQQPVNNSNSVTVNPVPKAPFPSGPNFKINKAAAPSFKPSVGGTSVPLADRPPPPPAVNAGEILNPNSRLYTGQTQPQPQSHSYQPQRINSNSSTSQPPRTPPYSAPLSPRAPGYSPQPQVTPPAPRAPGYSPHAGVPPQSPRGPAPGGRPSTGGGGVGGGAKKVVCQACQQPMDGPFVSAIGKTWHPEHFCCSSCTVSLQNQAFVEENNNLFCEKCYNQFYAPKCAHCNNAIIGNCVNALGKSWHPDHFVCSFCNQSFGNDGFLVDNGRPYCGKCFEDLFSVKCGKCNQPITGGEKYVEALNKNWHSECFSCTQCNVRLEGNSFYVNRGLAYCHQHK